MAKKIRLTRPELKLQRDSLQRYERYLPTLKLKQQQLQLSLRQVAAARRQAEVHLKEATDTFEPYQAILKDVAGVNVRELAEPSEIKTGSENIAGVNVPVFESLEFPLVSYSLFATPAWVDAAIADLRNVTQRRVEMDIVDQRATLLQRELTKIIQRVNLFVKVKIPEAQEAIRRIRIRLGDEMTAGVGRAKIAKGKLVGASHESDDPNEPHDVMVPDLDQQESDNT